MLYANRRTSGSLFSKCFIKVREKGLNCCFELIKRGQLVLFKYLRDELFSKLCDFRPRMSIQHEEDRYTFLQFIIPREILHIVLPAANRCLNVIDICEFLR